MHSCISTKDLYIRHWPGVHFPPSLLHQPYCICTTLKKKGELGVKTSQTTFSRVHYFQTKQRQSNIKERGKLKDQSQSAIKKNRPMSYTPTEEIQLHKTPTHIRSLKPSSPVLSLTHISTPSSINFVDKVHIRLCPCLSSLIRTKCN